MPLNSVKLYSKQGYYEDVYEEIEGTQAPQETPDPALDTDPAPETETATDSTSDVGRPALAQAAKLTG